jgi:hypothetical protein
MAGEPQTDVPATQRNRLACLLDAYAVISAPVRAGPKPAIARFGELLDGFVECRTRADEKERQRAAVDHERFSDLLTGYGEVMERHRQRQEQFADEFNLLDVMKLTTKEVRHSMVLAWLLDHDLRKLGTHAQGSLGLRLFLSEFGLPAHYADCNYWVRREVAGDDSIVDVEVACRGQFIIHIENKIWSHEGTDQTDREWLDLRRRAADLAVADRYVHALYLAPHGAEPRNRNFKAIPWGRVVRVLEAFADRAKPPDVKLFARHYARGLRRFIVTQEMGEEDNAEGTSE